MFCITSGPEHTFEFVNKAHIKALGFDATGMKVREAQPESVEVHGLLDGVYTTGETAALHEIPVTLGKSLRYFDLTYAAKRDNEGNINGIMILGNEVTDRVLIDQKIAFERKRVFSFFEQLPAAVAVISGPDFVFELANKHYSNLFGGQRDIIGKPLHEVIPDLSPEFYKILKTVIETTQSYSTTEYPVEIDWNNSGFKELRYINFFYQPLLNLEGVAEGIIAFVYDITDIVVAKTNVSNALKIRDEFLSIASHELKTPLTSINLQIQSTQRRIAKKADEFSFEKLDLLFARYKKQNDRLIRLVDDMLDLSKINLGKLSFEFHECDLRSIVETSFDHIKELFEDKNSSLEITGETTPVLGMYDKERMEQVLINLLINALKYGEEKPVTIELKTAGKRAYIKVKDQGPGIPQEKFTAIFDKFERVPASIEVSGLGIGLFIAKEIVEAHKGKIWVESAEGQGSTFVVELPKF